MRHLQGERNYIMQVVCEATQNGDVQVQVGAFECLVKIMTLYYDKMAFYMERALFGVRNLPCLLSYITNLSSVADCHGYEAFGGSNRSAGD